VLLKDLENTACKHFNDIDQTSGIATFMTPDFNKEIVYLNEIRKYLEDRGWLFEWVETYNGPIEIPKGWKICKTWASCPECTKCGHVAGHVHCYPFWIKRILDAGGIVIDGPFEKDWDWFVYYTVPQKMSKSNELVCIEEEIIRGKT